MRQSFRDNGLMLKAARGSDRLRSRLTIVVSKKVAKQAVRRNRIKRVLREAVRKESRLPSEAQAWVLVVLPGFEVAGVQEARAVVQRLFQKAFLA